MKATIQYEGSMSEPFDINSGVKQLAVSLRPPSSASSFSVAEARPSGPQPKECTYTPDQIDNCSTLTDWEQRRRCALPSSETCSSLMTVQSLHSPNNNSSVSWIGSPKLAKTSGSPSAWKRPTCWAKTWTPQLLLLSTAMNWMLSILPWFHRQRQPGRQPVPPCRNQPAYREGHNNVGPTDNSCLGESQTDCGNQYSSERSVHHQYTPVRQWGMDNICQARAEAEQPPHAQPTPHPRNYMERKSCLMPRSLNALVSPTCTRCSGNEGCAGSATCAGWKMGAYRRTSSMARLPQARNL